jgi:hypothetical protein
VNRPPAVTLADLARAAVPADPADKWMGARYVVHRGKRHYLTAGQQRKLYDESRAFLRLRAAP